jgi:alkanesulfonate monooxygenase SsuD/methylene tetrahydromethanopterin reductase-like flavin-dependent oxidoreductase (luciferase family)
VRFGFAVPSFGVHADPGRIRDLLVAGDELGFDGAWFPDHIAVPDYVVKVNLSPPFLEPLAACAWGLGITKRLRFGTDVLVAPYRSALVVAAATNTMASLAPGRVVLGVGVGYLKGEFEVLGVGPYERRGSLTDEFLRELRTPPEGYTVASASTPVPVWVGGNHGAARRRAALLGDGWHPLWMPNTRYARGRQQILALRAEAGLTTPFIFSYSCGTTRLLGGPRESWPATPVRGPASSEFSYAPEPWTAEDGRPRLVGTPDQVVSDLRLLETAGVDHVTLRFGATDVGQLERFAAEVSPAFLPSSSEVWV